MGARALKFLRLPLRRARSGAETPLAPLRYARVGAAAAPWVSALLFSAVTLAVTALIVLTGGAPTTLGHLYYVPILYVAVRHGTRAATVAATVAGLAIGPWMPSSVPGDEHQPLGTWLVRLFSFLVVGIVAAMLSKTQSRAFEVLVRDMYVARGLRAAIRHNQIRVHYQPLIDLSDGAVVGFEALCRWRDTRGREVPPVEFIPEAERTGVITKLGARVLHQAVNQAQRWADEGRTGLLITVNVSTVQLSEPEFIADLKRLFRDGAANGLRLCLEITETAIIADPVNALATLSEARELGVIIALDDFGTGQSSLAYLADFPIDIIKIDRSFVGPVALDPKGHSLVEAMVQMAHSLGAITIAEGIENLEQLKALRAIGCAMGQGYFLGFPDSPEVVDWERRDMAPATGRLPDGDSGA